MWFLAVAALVVTGVCAGIGGSLAALVRWLGRSWGRTLVLYDPLGRYAYEALYPLLDAGKITVWAFILCGGAQVGLLLYAGIVSEAELPIYS
jgi:hypothetical protein